MWELLYSPASRTSIKANWDSPSNRELRSLAVIFFAMAGPPPLKDEAQDSVFNINPALRFEYRYPDGAAADVRASNGKDASQFGMRTRDVGSSSKIQAAPPRLVAMEMNQAMS